jgi:hypothetical protein
MTEDIMSFFERRLPPFLKASMLTGPTTYTIESAEALRIKGEVKPILRFRETASPLILIKPNAEFLKEKVGPRMDQLPGRRVTLEAEALSIQGKEVKSIRIVEVLPLDQQLQENPLPPPSMLEWTRHIDVYESRGWVWIPIRPNSKEPYRGEAWTEQAFNRDSILKNIQHGGNLAIVAGPSGLVVLDLDIDQMPRLLSSSITLTQRTSRGYQFFTREPFDHELFNRLKEAIPELDIPRTGPMYTVVPLSRTCTQDHGNKHDCKVHDLRVRTWVGEGLEAEALQFPEFVRTVLK